MPELNLNFEIPEIKIQVTAIEYICGQIKGEATRTNTGYWKSWSSTKNWDDGTFATLEEAQDHAMTMMKAAATKKAAEAALNEQLEMFDA